MFSLLVLLAIIANSSASYKTLLPEQNRLYTFTIKANVSSGTSSPVHRSSYWTLEGTLKVQTFDDFSRARFTLGGLKTGLNSDQAATVPAELLQVLSEPWEAGACESWLRAGQLPRAALNLQRAISYNFHLHSVSGTAVLQEPCLYGTCVSTYSKWLNRVRKYTTAATRATNFERCSPPAQWRWRPVRTEKSNYLFTAERDYYLSDNGLDTMDLKSSFQYNTYGHVLGVFTDMTIHHVSSKPVESVEKMNLTEYSIQYDFHTYSDPSNGIWNTTQSEMKNRTYEMLLKIAKKGIDADNIVRNATLIHSLDFIDLLNTMSQLDYSSLRQLFDDVQGTSYELETARSIFFEVLPYVRNDAGARLIKYLVTEQKSKIEDATLLSLLRKLPFNIVDYSRGLLEELEVVTKLGPDYSQEIRHAGILSFATLVYKTMETNFDQQYFDDIYDKYLRMFNYCPQYIDRLVWLQGLINIGRNGVNYLDEIYTDNKKDRHERLWAALASINIWNGAGLENSLPILMNETEHIQLRIIALHAILRTSLDGRDFYNIHEYIMSCNNPQLQKFWYSTVKNLQMNRFFKKYGAVSSLIPFLTPQLKSPALDQWATNNIIMSQAPSSHSGSHGPSMQLMTAGGPKTAGAPEMILVEFTSGGDVVFHGALYIIAEGVTSNVFKRIQKFNSTLKFERLLKTFADMKIEVVEPEKVHIDIILKVFDKTVYATHIDQEKFNSWNLEDVRKSIEDFVRFGSHINQQMVYYPIQMVKYFPTEIGTPIRLHSTVVSFTSIRGNVTAPSLDGLSWRNDLHIRYHGASVTTMSTDGFLPPSEHSVRIQQSVVVHLPIKLDVKLSLANRSIELTWTNPVQNGGVAIHSRTQLTTATMDSKEVKTISPSNEKSNKGILVSLFDCEDPEVYMSEDNVMEHLRSNILSSLKSPHVIISSLPLFNPAVGSCGLILPARQLETGNKLDLELRLDQTDWFRFQHDFNYSVFYALRYYKETDTGVKEKYFDVTGFAKLKNEFESIDLSMEYKFSDQNAGFTFCLQNHHQDLSPFSIDFSKNQTKSIGDLSFRVAENEIFSCFPDENDTALEDVSSRNVSSSSSLNVSSLVMRYEIEPHGENDRDVKIHADGDEGVYQIIKFIKDSSNVRWPSDIKGLLDKLFDQKKFTNDAMIKERNGDILMSFNNGESLHHKADVLSWFPPKHTPLQMLIDIGVYHVCHVNRNNSIVGKRLIIGDCTKKPSFAVIESVNEDGDSLTIIANDNVIEFNPKINKMRSSDDLHVRAADDAYIVTSRITGVILLYQKDHSTIVLVPQPLRNTACGTCVI